MKQQRPRVTLYTTRQCAYCRQAKALLQKLGVRFTEFDIERSRRAFMEFQRTEGRGVPLIVVGRHRLDGFDPGKIKRLLRREGYDA